MKRVGTRNKFLLYLASLVKASYHWYADFLHDWVTLTLDV